MESKYITLLGPSYLYTQKSTITFCVYKSSSNFARECILLR